MIRSSPPLSLPLFEDDGETHRRDCECPRCDAGFRPSERQRNIAAQRLEARKARAAAEAALARKRERARIKALRLALELEEEERRTAERLRADAQLRARLSQDPRLTALLDSRRAGRPMNDAVAEVERRFPARASEPLTKNIRSIR
jgi:hypothetical protein